MSPTDLLERSQALREAFDRSFALPAVTARASTLDYLALRVGAEPWAVALSEVASVHADRSIVQVPGRLPALLGLVALRGEVHAVHDLSALIGGPRSAPGRWLLVPARRAGLALAFTELEGTRRVAPDEVVNEAAERAGGAGALVRGAIQDGELLRPVIHLASVIEAVEQGCREVAPAPKER